MDGVFLSNFSYLRYLQALTAAVPSLRQGSLAGRLLLGSGAAVLLPTTVAGADRARLAGVVSADAWAAPGLAPARSSRRPSRSTSPASGWKASHPAATSCDSSASAEGPASRRSGSAATPSAR